MTPAKKNVYLIGPMGSGKTTIGNRLAHKLGLAFYDCDHEIEARCGADINLIFEIEGEVGFRARETRMLEELSTHEGVLLATGGGAVLSGVNRELLKKSGLVLYLRTSVGQQLERLRRDRSRPLLLDTDKERTLTEMAEIRNPLYESIADLVFPVNNRNIDGTVSQIYQAIRQHLGHAPQEQSHDHSRP
jgi:shikimate kinase